MKKSTYIVYFLVPIFAVMIIGCQPDEPKTTFYQGINGQDTARLTLNVIENSFYGEYEVRNRSHIKRTGAVRGTIKGDTLLGDYYYQPNGGRVKKRIPFAFLQKDSALLVGKGVASSYMGIPFFVPDIPIDYTNPEFVLVRTNLDSTGYLHQKVSRHSEKNAG